MKRLSHLTLVLLLVSAFQILDIQANPVEPGSAIQEDVPPVVAYMRQVGQSLRQMRRQLTPDKQAENLKLVKEIRENLEKARGEEPLKTPEIPAQERDAFLNGYQELVDKAITTVDKLEAVVRAQPRDGKNPHVHAAGRVAAERILE